MNFFYMSRALTRAEFQDSALASEKPGPFLLTAYPNHPLAAMVELALAAIEIVVLWRKQRCLLQRLMNPLDEDLLAFQKKSIMAETLLWAHAYIRDGVPLRSAFDHWSQTYLCYARNRDIARYGAINSYQFEYAYRLMNMFPGGPKFDLTADGFIADLIREKKDLDSVCLYDALNQSSGYTGVLSQWMHDPIFNSILEGVRK